MALTVILITQSQVPGRGHSSPGVYEVIQASGSTRSLLAPTTSSVVQLVSMVSHDVPLGMCSYRGLVLWSCLYQRALPLTCASKDCCHNPHQSSAFSPLKHHQGLIPASTTQSLCDPGATASLCCGLFLGRREPISIHPRWDTKDRSKKSFHPGATWQTSGYIGVTHRIIDDPKASVSPGSLP